MEQIDIPDNLFLYYLQYKGWEDTFKEVIKINYIKAYECKMQSLVNAKMFWSKIIEFYPEVKEKNYTVDWIHQKLICKKEEK